jgi:iron complex transport system substrate-binding protein
VIIENSNITKEQLSGTIEAWYRADIQIKDVRHQLIADKDSMIKYTLPASVFILICTENADVFLNSNIYNVKRYGVFHGGKGIDLTIYPLACWAEYYLIYYVAKPPVMRKDKWYQLIAHINPFQMQYGFLPAYPLDIIDLFRGMYNSWIETTQSKHLFVKSAFYQLVYKVYVDLEEQNVDIIESDMVLMAKQYLNIHSNESISLRELSDNLGLSYSSFYRGFKQKTGKTPQQYLIETRVQKAQVLLEEGMYSNSEIAQRCGFSDEHSFYRMFKKNRGTSPKKYRHISHYTMNNKAIENRNSFSYNRNRTVSLNEPIQGGEYVMFKKLRINVALLTALGMVLLSGCAANTGGTADPNAVKDTVVSEQEIESSTKIVKTDLGDVEIPTDPKRIVGIQCYNILESLGAEAVDMSTLEHLTYFSDNYNWEELMALEPDLIIASTYEGADEYLERCRKIAPTVTFDDSDTVLEKQSFIAETIGKEEVAESQIEAYQESVEKSVQKLKDMGIYGSKVAIIQYTSSGVMYSYGDKIGRGGDVLYHLLGFQATDIVQEKIIDGTEYYLQLSLETLPEYIDADFIVIMHPETGMDSFYSNEVWKSMDVVKQGRFFEITNEEYMDLFNMPSIVEIQKAIELYLTRFEEVTLK